MSFILNNSNQKSFLYSKDNIICKVNKNFVDLTSYSQDEVVGKSISELKTLLRAEDLPHSKSMEPMKRCIIHTKNKVEKKIIVSCETLINENERVFFIEECQHGDIVHRFKMEQYSLLKHDANHVGFNYASLSYPDFKIVYINEKGYTALNSNHQNIDSASSMIGKCFFDYYNLDKDETENLIFNINDSIKKEPYAYICTHKSIANGEENFTKTIFQPVFGVNNEIKKVIALGVNINDEIRSKESLIQALKTQEEMFLDISHELKTPLNIIFSASQLLGMNLLDIDSSDNKNLILKNTNSIIQNSYRLIKLINNISEISRLESGFYELDLYNTNIVQVVEDIVESVSVYVTGKKLKIIFDTDVEEKIIACDPYKIERIMLNLIANAIKFSDPNGTIFVNMAEKADFIEISVVDEGIGIDEKHIDLIFVKFLQVKESLKSNPGGTGIGLSLVKSLVELHNGTISVESELGKGSTFKIQLPIIRVKDSVSPDLISPLNVIESIKFEFSDIDS